MSIDAKDLKGKTGIRRLINATRYSCEGIRAALRTEEAFRQEFYLSLVLLLVLPFLPLPLVLSLFCGFSLIFLLVVELLNTGIEAAIDRIGSEIHPLSKVAKDTASAAVLLALLHACAVWAIAGWTLIRQFLA